MRKTLATLAVFFAVSAHAEDWHLVASSVDGIDLYSDADTVSFIGQSETVQVEGLMKYVNKEILPPFKARIDAKQCIEDHKGTLTNIFSDGTVKEYPWDVKGHKMFDAQGQFLCAYAIEVLRQYDKGVKPAVKRIKA